MGEEGNENRTQIQGRMVGLVVRLALEGFTEDQIVRFVDAITDMGWRLMPPETGRMAEILDHSPTLEGLRDQMAARRLVLGISWREVARQVGTSPSTISRWVTGAGEPNGRAVMAVFRWLETEDADDG